MAKRHANNELNSAQDRFTDAHGEREAKRLFASIESVVQGAPLDQGGWDTLLFLGTAARIYASLAEETELTADAFWNAVIARENNHHVGAIGWELLWQWRVAMYLWDSSATASTGTPVGRHGETSKTAQFRSSYERGLRDIVRSEIVSYYFDHTEHSRDVDFIIREDGLADTCDAHGVAAYYHRVANIAVVRNLFKEISTVPSTMKLETFMGAVRGAYRAAEHAGHGQDLRKFDVIAADIASHRNQTAALSDKLQRSLYPDDSSLSMMTDDDTIMDPRTNIRLSSGEARVIIGAIVNQIQINQNSLGIQASSSEFEQVRDALSEAPPSVLSRVFREWLPQALVASTVALLFALLRGG
ncbi:MAG: hypothetical protein F4X98_11000 [Gammaproteobacteria bacterium]|nr:hypothetical protein [Gammaproteobacteria bacterium]